MKKHTNDFKEEIKLLGKQQEVKITYTQNNENITLNSEDINTVTPNYKGNLLKSVMKGIDIDSNISIPKGTQIKFEYGLLVNGSYEYLNYGNYIVYSSEKQEDLKSYKITCYDKLLYSMVDYKPITIDYPCTNKAFLSALCAELGLTFKDSNFAKQDKILEKDFFTEQGFTYRDVLDQISETTGGTICLTLND